MLLIKITGESNVSGTDVALKVKGQRSYIIHRKFLLDNFDCFQIALENKVSFFNAIFYYYSYVFLIILFNFHFFLHFFICFRLGIYLFRSGSCTINTYSSL
jgi:hypothetical protein